MSSKMETLQAWLRMIGILGFVLGGPVVGGLSAGFLVNYSAPWWAWLILFFVAILWFAAFGIFSEDHLSFKKDALDISLLVAGMLIIVVSLVFGLYSLLLVLSEQGSSPWWAWGGYLLLCSSVAMIVFLAGSNYLEYAVALFFIVIPLTLGFSIFTDDLRITTIALSMLGPVIATALSVGVRAVLSH